MKYQTPKSCKHCGKMMHPEDLLKGHRSDKEWENKQFCNRRCTLGLQRAERRKKSRAARVKGTQA